MLALVLYVCILLISVVFCCISKGSLTNIRNITMTIIQPIITS